MDKRLYPSGKNIVKSSDIETTPTVADYIKTARSLAKEKWISLTNLFASPPAIGATTPAAVTSTINTSKQILVTETELTGSGAISGQSIVALNKSGGSIAATIAAPTAGWLLVIYQKDSGTASHTVTLTSGTYNGSNTVATFNAQNECLVLFGVSATRFVILENLGSVGLSGP